MSKFYTQGHRLKAIVGHFGSGKTEIAMNMAMAIREENLPTALVDLDIVNPYFRTAEQKDFLISKGIEVLYPTFALSTVDIPTLPAHRSSVFERDDLQTIFEVGGDDSGAVAIGHYYPQIKKHGLDMYYVINPYRPRSSSLDLIYDLIEKIQRSARTEITGFINNANIADYTTPDELRYGRDMILEISAKTGIPLVLECGLAQVLNQLDDDSIEKMPIQRILKPEWMEH